MNSTPGRHISEPEPNTHRAPAENAVSWKVIVDIARTATRSAGRSEADSASFAGGFHRLHLTKSSAKGRRMPDMPPAPRRRPLWRLFIMPALLLVAASAWSGFWFYAASEVGVRADAWRPQEARSGRVFDCARRSVAG